MKSESKISIVNVSDNQRVETVDVVAVEEPLEIKLAAGSAESTAISITMRTPGDDYELAVGFLISEGLLNRVEDLGERKSVSQILPNEITVTYRTGSMPDISRLKRHFYTTSSCGVCGKASIDALYTSAPPEKLILESPVSTILLQGLPEKLLHAQKVFGQTGGLHAAGLFTADGQLVLMREDVGRHNAVDKLLGAAFLANDSLPTCPILLLSGRSSFELIQKAVMSGIPIVASIGAPSSLAVNLARQHGITLVGFLSNTRLNIYSGESNLVVDADETAAEV